MNLGHRRTNNRGLRMLAAAGLLALSGCGSADHAGARMAAAERRARAAIVTVPLPAGLTARQLAGQRIVYSYSGPTPPPSLLTLIRHGEAGGVILFSANILSHTQVRTAIASLQRADREGPMHAPLLVMTDQEGGQVRRLTGAPVLSERQIGASPRAQTLATQAGSQAAANLRGVGININLAPVLDVYRHAGDFIDRYERSYSSNATRVSSLGADFITASQRGGVAATAKHFPGLGAAGREQDTDERAVTIPLSAGTLRSTDEAPYRSAIAAGVKLVMTSWALYPALDPKLPAGLSPTIIGGELRGRLGFTGVTITDSLGAGAITSFGPIGRRALLAARAGADLLLCSTIGAGESALGQGTAVLARLAAAITHGELARKAAEEADGAILALRRGL